MEKLHTKTQTFEVEWAAPASFTGNVSFLAKILNSDMETVHNTFKQPEETELLVKEFIEDELVTEVGRYEGYTKYMGFNIDYDNGIIVTLNKNLEV